jgi:hypothetical protein
VNFSITFREFLYYLCTLQTRYFPWFLGGRNQVGNQEGNQVGNQAINQERTAKSRPLMPID